MVCGGAITLVSIDNRFVYSIGGVKDDDEKFHSYSYIQRLDTCAIDLEWQLLEFKHEKTIYNSVCSPFSVVKLNLNSNDVVRLLILGGDEPHSRVVEIRDDEVWLLSKKNRKQAKDDEDLKMSM